MLVLSILHNIFLSREEIKRLHNGENIEVISASLPVWYVKGTTSEPAEEVFCKYTITNQKEDIPIIVKKDGYVINVPQIPKDYIEAKISDAEWETWDQNQKNKWYLENPKPLSSASLLPLSEGDSEFLHFKEYNN